MTTRTHLLGGAVAAAAVIEFCLDRDPEALDVAAFTVSCLWGALLPDIDIPTSKMGQAFSPVSHTLFRTVGHRTVTHSLLILVLLYFGVKYTPEGFQVYPFGVLVGWASHILLDFLNRAGVPLLWPIKQRFWIFGIKSGTKNEWRFEGALWFVLIWRICVLIKTVFVPDLPEKIHLITNLWR